MRYRKEREEYEEEYEERRRRRRRSYCLWLTYRPYSVELISDTFDTGK